MKRSEYQIMQLFGQRILDRNPCDDFWNLFLVLNELLDNFSIEEDEKNCRTCRKNQTLECDTKEKHAHCLYNFFGDWEQDKD